MSDYQPKLRFPEFSSDWLFDRLSFFCTINPKKPNSPNDGRVSFISMSAVNENAQIVSFESVDYKFVSSGFTGFKNNDVLVAKITPCFENGKGALVANLINGVGFGSTEFHVLRAKEKNFADFVYHFTNTSRFRLVGERNMQGSAGQKRVTTDYLKLYKTYFPSSKFEQQKIASFLTSVDSKISQLTENHRLLKEYKKGVMQQIFSQQLRFKDEDGKAFPEWKIERIGKYLEAYKELVSVNTEIPILTSSRTGLYPQERSVINEGSYGVVPLGYFTYRHMSDDLVFKFNVNRIWERGAVSKEYPVFKTVGMDCYFLELQLNEGNDFKKFAIQQKQGGTRTRLYFKNLTELKLNIPCLKEQQKISQFLQSIDKKIDAVAQQVEQTKQFKKGLLQQMFV